MAKWNMSAAYLAKPHIVNDNGSSTETAQQYVNFGQAEDLRFGTEDFTLAFWYRSAQGGASEGALLSNKDWTSGSNQGFTVGNFTNGLRVNYTAQGHGRDDIYGLGANDDAWHFIVIGFDRDGDMTAWVDNEEAGSASISDTLGQHDRLHRPQCWARRRKTIWDG